MTSAPQRAYKVKITNQTMAPRFTRGEIVIVDPDSPPKIGDDVFIPMEGGGLGRRLVALTAKTITLRQFRPRRDITIPRYGATMHRIIFWGTA